MIRLKQYKPPEWTDIVKSIVDDTYWRRERKRWDCGCFKGEKKFPPWFMKYDIICFSFWDPEITPWLKSRKIYSGQPSIREIQRSVLSVYIMHTELPRYPSLHLKRNDGIISLRNRIWNYIFKVAVNVFLFLKTTVLAIASLLRVVLSFLNPLRSLTFYSASKL